MGLNCLRVISTATRKRGMRKMGKCRNCGKQIKIVSKEKKCPSCGENPYICWNCKEEITGGEKECAICHFYVCPSCKHCGSDCLSYELIQGLKEKKSLREMVEYDCK